MSGRRARITWASEIEPEPVVWAWRDEDGGRIPAGSLSVAAGREGTGKSSFGIWMAAQITRGLLPGSFHGKPRRVLYVAVEDSWKHTIVPRLMAAGADRSMVGRFDVVNDFDEAITLSLPLDNRMFEDQLVQREVALAVVDPLMSVIDARIDSHRTRDVRTALDPLAAIADRTGAVILGIAHFSKASGSDISSLITGSGAFKDVPRSVLGFVRDDTEDDGARVMTQSKNSLGREDLPSLKYTIESTFIETRKGLAETGKFTWHGVSERTASEILRDTHSGEDPAEAGDAKTWLRDYLTECGGEADAASVLKAGKAAGFADSTLKNARRKVATTSRVGFGSGAIYTWKLKTTPHGYAHGSHGSHPPVASTHEIHGDTHGDLARPATPAPVLTLPLAPTPAGRTCPDCGTAVGATSKCVNCSLARAHAAHQNPAT